MIRSQVVFPAFTCRRKKDHSSRRFLLILGMGALLSAVSAGVTVSAVILLDTLARKPLYLIAYFLFITVFAGYILAGVDRKSTRLNSSHSGESRMPSSA